ncbi:MAG: trigger factor [Gammaproteobacteria bacterium]|nr:trigger factor [Gammaproteobacteria bacterium]
MQVSVETTGSLTRKMTIAVPAGEFEGRIADRVRSTAKTVSLPGFRRGRVPLKEVERRFGDALRSEVASDLVKSSLEDALRQEELPMVGAPSVELVNLDPGADLEFTATFEVLPEVDLVDLSTLHVRRPFAEIGETDIDEMVESLRKQRTEWNPVERAVAADDRVVVDYSVTVDGEVVGEPQADFTFVVGSSQVATELDTAVVGMTVGETRAFPLTIQRNIDET